ncbi:dihydropteroate synthase [Kineosphaera limosa]|uniref:Dihydropteroate synthase n=1 Tax=Kineosphaera limosa NBRC 100340 TaxID=1184609 RepID=K6VP43_9MICO|nr:dihydropteroate synthase [Kineosphaera limosa]NYE01696.1 dihydropteroate synthase [Kineosphaera limosa]GAB97988.1 dihydropteroate synthase [Kineosphaera limosa NBRC 100340]
MPGPLPLLMGVVNVTPDSFSDGGRWFDTDDGIAHGIALADAGAAILDIGGESTRPGAQRPEESEELRRTIPVIEALLEQPGMPPISIDTMRARVAAAAIEAGARVVNDVSGGLADPDMVRVLADAPDVDFVAMHWRGHSADMQRRAVYGDVVREVRAELDARVEQLVAAGIDPERIVLDPGLGFAKTAEHNWQLVGRLDELVGRGYRVLIGASRKAFLGRLEAGADGTPAPPQAREAATAAITLLCAQAGVWCVRVHEIEPSRSALRVVGAVAAHAPDAGPGDRR